MSDEKRIVRVTLRLTPKEKEMLDEQAERHHLSNTSYICMLLALEAEKNAKKD